MYTHQIAHDRLKALADLILEFATKIESDPIDTILVWQDRVEHLNGLITSAQDEADQFAVYCVDNDPCPALIIALKRIDTVLVKLLINLEKQGRKFHKSAIDSIGRQMPEYYVN